MVKSNCLYVLVTVVLSVCMGFSCGSRILLVFPLPSGSHGILGDGYVRNLVNAGHEVTYITPFQPKRLAPNLRHIIVNETLNVFLGQTLNITALMTAEVVLDQHQIFEMMFNVTKIMLKLHEVQQLMNDPREHFDLVIAERMFNEVYSGFSAVFDCPFIWSFPYEPNYDVLSLIDEATNPAYTPNVGFGYVPPFSFLERVEMLWYQTVGTVFNTFYYRSIEKEFYESVFKPILARKGRTLPDYEDARLNASMILGNTHSSCGMNMRLPQNFKSIGGYHVDPDIKPLPEDLKRIMDSSKEGVIYFSMGSNLRSKDFPIETQTSLLEMFGTLKQTIIWKFEESFPKAPKNVHILKWAPQLSILAHPNCALFISHGGLLSTIEAVHFGVPIAGIPVYFDQFNNINRAAKNGYAKKISLSYNPVQDLKETIEEMIGNPQYKQKIKELSFIYHNRPVPPGRELVHWVEHVIATRGAVYLRSPALHVPFYQKLYLDLLALVCLVIFAVVRFVSYQNFTSKRNIRPNKKKSS